MATGKYSESSGRDLGPNFQIERKWRPNTGGRYRAHRRQGSEAVKRTFGNSRRCPSMQRLLCNLKGRLGRLRGRIGRLPPYPALLIVAIPLAVVEPLKLATILIAGEGHWITSGLVLLFAYAISLFVTHWLFVAVKPKLLTLHWFSRAWATLVTARYKSWCWITKRAGHCPD
jgi:hypothetical protein